MNTSIALGAIAPIDPTLPSELRQRRERQQLNEQSISMNEAQLGRIGMENEERQAKIARAQRVSDAIGRAGGDPEKALPEIWKIDPNVGQLFAKHVEEKRASAIKLYEQQQDAQRKAITAVLRTPAEKRGSVYKAQIAGLLNSPFGFKPENFPAELPDEDTLRAYATNNLGMKELQEMDLKAAGENRAQSGEKRADAKAAREQQEFEDQRPGKKVDPKTGLTPYQAATLGEMGKVHAETGRHNLAVETETRTNNREANAIRRARASQESAQTANSRAVDERQVDKSMADLEADERRITRMLVQLGTAIQGGKLYVDGRGNAKPLSAVNASDEERPGLVDEMRSRYQALAEEQKKLIGAKNSLLERSGRKIGKSTNQAAAEIDAGVASIMGRAPEAVASSAKPAQSQAPQAARPRARNAAGEVIEWDGSAWVDRHGKPVK